MKQLIITLVAEAQEASKRLPSAAGEGKEREIRRLWGDKEHNSDVSKAREPALGDDGEGKENKIPVFTSSD